MSLSQLTVTNLRSIEHATLEIPPGLTLIYGNNGSGKTSLLEAAFMLGRGRSFRSRDNNRLIMYGQDHLRVTGRTARSSQLDETLSLEVGREGSSAHIGGRSAESLAELSKSFAVQVIEPGIHRLVEEGGYRRRRWLDWAVFHVEPTYMDSWVRYNRALKQRNAALRTSALTSRGSQINTWDAEIARLGESIAVSRARLMERLAPFWRDEVTALTGLDVELHHARGWSLEQSLGEALAAARTPDLTRQVTHVGPHRADVAVRLHGRPAREVLSRGQQKLVAAAMIVAQLRLLRGVSELRSTLLLDDPAAELDAERLECFIDRVSGLNSQLIVTSLHSESRLFGAPERTFRVVQGRVQPV